MRFLLLAECDSKAWLTCVRLFTAQLGSCSVRIYTVDRSPVEEVMALRGCLDWRCLRLSSQRRPAFGWSSIRSGAGGSAAVSGVGQRRTHRAVRCAKRKEVISVVLANPWRGG